MGTSDTINSIGNSLSDDWTKFVHFLPQLVAALVIIVIGIIAAAIISSLVKKLIKMLEEDKHVSGFLSKWKIHVRAAEFVGMFSWWVVFLAFLSAAVQVLRIDVLTGTINSLVAFAPKLFAAAIVAGLTLVAARVVRGLVTAGLDGAGVKGTKPISIGVYVAVLIFGLTIAVAQLGLNLTLITANITVIIAGLALAGALAFGIGGRDVAGSLLAGWSTRDLIKKGQTLNVDGVKGKVVQVNASGIVLETTDGGKQIVSHSRLMK